MVNQYYEQELLFGNGAQSSSKRKALARLMLNSQIEKAQIAKVLGVSIRQVYNYELQGIELGNAEEYRDNRYRPTSEMKGYETEIIKELVENPPATAKEAAARIFKLSGLKRSPTQVRKFMHKLGLKPLKTAQIPAQANPEAQEKFLTSELEPRIEMARINKQVLLFMDAAHFVWQVYLGVLWCLSRIFVPAASGRQRINVLGALDPITKELTKIVNLTYITSATVCDLLRMISEKYKGCAITIVLDNARYQRCKLVMETAVELHIELLFLPTYSPNLNLIERLWRFMKKECLYSKYYKTANEFEESINNCLAQINTTKKADLDTLLTLKFQRFDSNWRNQVNQADAA
jgi:transposase